MRRSSMGEFLRGAWAWLAQACISGMIGISAVIVLAVLILWGVGFWLEGRDQSELDLLLCAFEAEDEEDEKDEPQERDPWRTWRREDLEWMREIMERFGGDTQPEPALLLSLAPPADTGPEIEEARAETKTEAEEQEEQQEGKQGAEATEGTAPAPAARVLPCKEKEEEEQGRACVLCRKQPVTTICASCHLPLCTDCAFSPAPAPSVPGGQRYCRWCSCSKFPAQFPELRGSFLEARVRRVGQAGQALRLQIGVQEVTLRQALQLWNWLDALRPVLENWSQLSEAEDDDDD